MIFTDRSRLPDQLTTFDLLKFLALVLMICDHIGFYFSPGDLLGTVGQPDLWWRVVGRWCVPIWFFLVGYARSRDLSPVLIGGAVLLVLDNMVMGLYVFALNNLWTIILVRLVLDRAARAAFRDLSGLVFVVGACLLLYPVTNALTEYGTMGLVLALLGYAVRHQGEAGAPALLRRPNFIRDFMILTIVFTVICQAMTFSTLSPVQMQAMAAGMAATTALCVYLPKTVWPRLSVALSGAGGGLIRLGGRYTLELYVLHLVVFKLVAMHYALGFPLYQWFDWEWTVYGSFSELPRPETLP